KIAPVAAQIRPVAPDVEPIRANVAAIAADVAAAIPAGRSNTWSKTGSDAGGQCESDQNVANHDKSPVCEPPQVDRIIVRTPAEPERSRRVIAGSSNIRLEVRVPPVSSRQGDPWFFCEYAAAGSPIPTRRSRPMRTAARRRDDRQIAPRSSLPRSCRR